MRVTACKAFSRKPLRDQRPASKLLVEWPFLICTFRSGLPPVVGKLQIIRCIHKLRLPGVLRATVGFLGLTLFSLPMEHVPSAHWVLLLHLP